MDSPPSSAELELATRVVAEVLRAAPAGIGALLLWGVRGLMSGVKEIYVRIEGLEGAHRDLREALGDMSDRAVEDRQSITRRIGQIEQHLAGECVPCTSHGHNGEIDPVEEQKDVLQHLLQRKRWRDRQRRGFVPGDDDDGKDG